jgi:hypothetical protein
MEASNKHELLKHTDCFLQRHPYNMNQQGAKTAGGPPQLAGVSSKPRQTMQKIDGEDSPNVRHLRMWETVQRASSSSMLTQGANSKPVEGLGPQ